MSVKTKLTIMISLIVVLLLALNGTLNDYSDRNALRDQTESEMRRLVQHLHASIAKYRESASLFEDNMKHRLQVAALSTAEKLPVRFDTVDSSRLSELAEHLNVDKLILLRHEGGLLVTVASSDAQDIGVVHADKPERAGSFWTKQVEAKKSSSQQLSKWGYYEDSLRNYTIGVYLSNSRLTEFTQWHGPDAILQDILRLNPSVLEITAIDMQDLLKEYKPVNLENQWILNDQPFELFSPSAYIAPSMQELQQLTQGSEFIYDQRYEGKVIIKGLFPPADNNPFAIAVVVDKYEAISRQLQKNRIEQSIMSAVLLVTIIILSYWLSDGVIRPIRMILWKVNEVALGRFNSNIQVRRKDELGQLATRVNAMSKNLDIYTTKLKLAFEENRSMKEYLESFINHTTDAIHVVDLEGRIIQVNHAFEELFGWAAEEATGEVLPLVPEPYLAEEKEAMEALMNGSVDGARETVRQTKDGEWIAVSLTISPIRDRNGAIHAIASITRDMRSRNNMEELLRQSEKLTTVGQLAAGVAHEIRNPLTTLRGFLQLQQQTNKLNQRHIDLMLSELDRINLIVGEFLILAKPQASKLERKDVRFVLGDVVSLLDSQAHLCNTVFVTEFCPDSCEISCEENQLKQVFINILKNALEAMPQGGTILIRVALNTDGHVAVSIIDEGIGIPEEIIPKLGDPFFTAKEAGTGLGIMVSQRIIQSHQGTMRISSKVDVGTTVTITLPTMDESNQAAAEERQGGFEEDCN